MDFSVVLPSYNEAGRIEKCIESVKASAGDEFEIEIIVVDNCSTDSTVECARKSGATVLESESRLPSIAILRCRGADSAKGEYLAFLDADMVVPQEWFANAKKIFDEGLEGALGFAETVPKEACWVARIWGETKYQRPKEVSDVDFLAGRNILISRKVYDAVGGFDRTLQTCEDKDLTLRLVKEGYRAIYVPGTTLTHLGHEKGFVDFAKKEFWRQNSTIDLSRHLGFSFRSLMNPLFSLWHVTLFIVTIITLIFNYPRLGSVSVLLWIVPSFLQSFRKTLRADAPLGVMYGYWLLAFVRWNASGFSLLDQIRRGALFRGKKQ